MVSASEVALPHRRDHACQTLRIIGDAVLSPASFILNHYQLRMSFQDECPGMGLAHGIFSFTNVR